MQFTPFAKMARLRRDCIITEKIDGTNAQVIIVPPAAVEITMPGNKILAVDPFTEHVMLAGSRTRFITPDDDNYGFAKWVRDHAGDLFNLGLGRHYGEWWGSGIQRRYGLDGADKRFSLFNTSRWNAANKPACCSVVPVLYDGLFSTEATGTAIERLRTLGSVAAPGFPTPEGIVCWHVAAGLYFKQTIEKDDKPKGGKD